MPPQANLRLGAAVAVAAALFTMLFGGVVFHFWSQLLLTALGLTALAFGFDPAGMRGLARAPGTGVLVRHLLLGAVSAVALYGIFAAGRWFALRLLPDAEMQIGAVYGLRAGTARTLIVLLLLCIGAGEEWFWRGYVQRRLALWAGARGVWLSVLIYGGVHAASGNPVLILAALTCGAFWAALFHFGRSIWMNVASHALWAALIFILRPLQ